MTTATSACTQSGLVDFPIGLTVYNNKLIVSNGSNGNSPNRLLIWNSIPTTNGVAADVVLGQVDFTTCGVSALPTAANTFHEPAGLTVDQNGRLYVADDLNHRVLIWNSIPTTNNTNADLVVGQSDFTSSSTHTTANGFGNFDSVFVSGNRMFVGDPDNHRVLIFNSLPTTNSVSADIVIGHSDFVTAGSGTTAASTFFFPRQPYVYGNQMFVIDDNNSRILIFNNTITTPSINLTTPPVSIGSGRYRLLGNINMNNNGGTYSLQTFQADLNGTGYGNIVFPGGRSDGGGNSIYDFIYDFDPTVGGGDINTNLTLKFLASTYNADTNTLFYFLPFKLKSVTSKQIVFNVNKNQISKIKDNISHFEVWSKTSSSSLWTKYIDNILPTQIDSNGDVYLTKTNSLTSISYKVKAVDNWNNSQESNILSFSNLSVPVNNFVSFTGIPIASPEPSSTPLELPSQSPEPTPTPEFVSETPQINNYLKYIIPAGIALLVLFVGIIFLRRKSS